MSKNLNKCASENSMLKFLTVSSVSSDSIVKGIIDDIINTAVKLPKSTRHRWNCQELKHRIFRSALIHVLAHFQRTTCSQIYFHFSSYLLRKPHLFVILTAIGWFIVIIQQNIYNILLINMTQSCQIKQRYTFHLHPAFIE
jgi:hypothetical protein